MAALMEDWLGPLIEEELQYSVEWKRRSFADSRSKGAPNIEPDPVYERLDKDVPFPYADDGSNLRARKHFPSQSQKAVQVHQVCVAAQACIPSLLNLTDSLPL